MARIIAGLKFADDDRGARAPQLIGWEARHAHLLAASKSSSDRIVHSIVLNGDSL